MGGRWDREEERCCGEEEINTEGNRHTERNTDRQGRQTERLRILEVK